MPVEAGRTEFQLRAMPSDHVGRRVPPFLQICWAMKQELKVLISWAWGSTYVRYYLSSSKQGIVAWCLPHKYPTKTIK